MKKYIEKQAPTVDEALALAMQELDGLDTEVENVEQEVLERGKKGLFGIGAVPAHVRISYDEVVVTPAMEAKKFVDGLLVRMGINGEAFPTEGEDGQIILDVRGEHMGAVIGRRGDTLDAIQYLTSLVVNRDKEEHIRIAIDTEGYRAKREESLQRLARKMAGKALRYHKNMTLEPMNPYERRIIHAELQDYQGVTTYSTGVEPNRRVVVALERQQRPSGGYRGNGGYRGGYRGSYRSRPRRDEE